MSLIQQSNGKCNEENGMHTFYNQVYRKKLIEICILGMVGKSLHNSVSISPKILFYIAWRSDYVSRKCTQKSSCSNYVHW